MTADRAIIEQGSELWHEMRATRLGASEVSAALGMSQFMPKNMRELVEVKKGIRKVYCNSAMQLGNKKEARARELAEVALDDVFEPQTFYNDELIASLDGLNFDGTVGIEIKTSDKSIDELSTQYYWQIQQQLFLSGAKKIYLVAYRAETDAIEISEPHTLKPDTKEILERVAKEFQEAMANYQPTKIDPKAERYFELAMQKAEIEIEMEMLKSELIESYKEGYEDDRLTVYKIKPRQTVDYKKAVVDNLPELDLTEYTKTGQESYGIKIKGKTNE